MARPDQLLAKGNSLMANSFDRRSFLRYSMMAGGAAGAVGLTGALSACSSGGSASGGGTTSTNPKVQLSWQKNIEFAGEYFAIENGYYAAEGLGTPELITGGGAGTGVETGLTSNKVWIGMSAPAADRAGHPAGRRADDGGGDLPAQPVLHRVLGRQTDPQSRGDEGSQDRRPGLQRERLQGAAHRQQHDRGRRPEDHRPVRPDATEER